MKSEEVSWPSVVIDDFIQNVDNKSVTDSTSRLQNLLVNYHNLNALFSMISSHLGYTVTSFGQDELQLCTKCKRQRMALALTFV
jgi:hypothetical protein